MSVLAVVTVITGGKECVNLCIFNAVTGGSDNSSVRACVHGWEGEGAGCPGKVFSIHVAAVITCSGPYH